MSWPAVAIFIPYTFVGDTEAEARTRAATWLDANPVTETVTVYVAKCDNTGEWTATHVFTREAPAPAPAPGFGVDSPEVHRLAAELRAHMARERLERDLAEIAPRLDLLADMRLDQ